MDHEEMNRFIRKSIEVMAFEDEDSEVEDIVVAIK